MHGLCVLPANIQDYDAAKAVLLPLSRQAKLPRLERLWADGRYGGRLVDWVREHTGWTLEIVTRPPGAKGFVLLPKRWIVERTFAWLLKCRRLVADYEERPRTSEALIRLAMLALMLRRLQPA